MIDMNIGDDVTLGGCYRQYFKDTQYEILSSTSQSTFYVFKNVTVPASISNCSYRGNGILDEVYGSYGGALNYIQEEIKNKNQIDENIKKESFILVDGRSRKRFEGNEEEPRAGVQKGCIPNSKNIPFQNCINSETNTFKTRSELIKIFSENNVDYFKPNVFTCGSGVTACVLGLAYFLISDRNAVIYDGSYSEWGKK